MSLVPTPSQPQAIAASQTSPRPASSRKLGIKQSPESKVNTVLRSVNSSMERSAPEYSQSGLPSPYPSNSGDTQSEASSAEQAPAAAPAAATAPYSAQQESRSNYSTSATPTSEYSVFPQSARSGSFPEHLQRPYHPASSHPGGPGGMAQTPTSPSSVPLQDAQSHQNTSEGAKSDTEVPVDPSIAAPSPTYAPHSQYSPYAAPPQDMGHNYPHPGSAGLYAQPRPDWTGYGGQPHPGHLPPGHHPFPPNAGSGPSQARPSQVYSFVPIPGAQQHKRPRRRYEEIERMYKCGWNGCEKAYGTLNHLNAHVTMQSHGQKRTPEEFKEIRKEWKARKKEEEQQRKAEEERQRQAAAAQNGGVDQPPADRSQPPTTYPGSQPVQLPPIGYQPQQYPAPPSGGQPMPEYGGNHMYPSYQGNPPYGQPNQPMYNQHNGGQQNH